MIKLLAIATMLAAFGVLSVGVALAVFILDPHAANRCSPSFVLERAR